jgi:hypothetical protein
MRAMSWMVPGSSSTSRMLSSIACHRGPRTGQPNREAPSCTQFAVDSQMAAHRFRQLTRDDQAQTCAQNRAGLSP